MNLNGLLTIPGLLLCLILPLLTSAVLTAHWFGRIPGSSYYLDRHSQPFGFRFPAWVILPVIVILVLWIWGLR